MRFLKEMLSNRDNTSSKRFNGTLLVLSFIIINYIMLLLKQYQIASSMAETGLGAALVFIIGAAIEKIWKPK